VSWHKPAPRSFAFSSETAAYPFPERRDMATKRSRRQNAILLERFAW
jgi:hypothetical protein